MFGPTLIAYMLLLHFVADFVLQSREMGKNKSVNFSVLLDHVSIQIMVFAIGLFLWPGIHFSEANGFAVSMGLIHGVIDWYIWRGYKWLVKQRIKRDVNHPLIHAPAREWHYWEDHYFYLTIGFDQLLHALTLVFLYSYWFG